MASTGDNVNLTDHSILNIRHENKEESSDARHLQSKQTRTTSVSYRVQHGFKNSTGRATYLVECLRQQQRTTLLYCFFLIFQFDSKKTNKLNLNNSGWTSNVVNNT